MRFPSREQSMGFYRELNTPENIIRHVIMVNKVAVFLSSRLAEKGEKIDLELVDKASLLHDLDKWLCLNDKSLVHGVETEKILKQKGFLEVGFYAKQHIAEFLTEFSTWEEFIISYSDKRVLNDKIVSLKERFDYINEKYPPKDPERRLEAIRHSYKIEKKIMEKIGMVPEDLDDFISKK